MGTKVELSQVQVLFGTTGPSSVHIGIGNSDDPTSYSGFTTVANSKPLLRGIPRFSVSKSAEGRYVMIWYTKLPPGWLGVSDQYEAQVYNVVVRGSQLRRTGTS